MTKDQGEIERLRRKYGIRSIIAILANIPVAALLVWGLTQRHEISFDDPQVRWSVVVGLLALVALECWLGYWIFVRMDKEIQQIRDVDDQSGGAR